MRLSRPACGAGIALAMEGGGGGGGGDGAPAGGGVGGEGIADLGAAEDDDDAAGDADLEDGFLVSEAAEVEEEEVVRLRDDDLRSPEDDE